MIHYIIGGIIGVIAGVCSTLFYLLCSPDTCEKIEAYGRMAEGIQRRKNNEKE